MKATKCIRKCYYQLEIVDVPGYDPGSYTFRRFGMFKWDVQVGTKDWVPVEDLLIDELEKTFAKRTQNDKLRTRFKDQ